MQIAAGVALFVLSVVLAEFAVRSGAPSCPLDAMYVPEREIMRAPHSAA